MREKIGKTAIMDANGKLGTSLQFAFIPMVLYYYHRLALAPVEC